MKQSSESGLVEPLFDANELRGVMDFEPRAGDGMPAEGDPDGDPLPADPAPGPAPRPAPLRAAA